MNDIDLVNAEIKRRDSEPKKIDLKEDNFVKPRKPIIPLEDKFPPFIAPIVMRCDGCGLIQDPRPVCVKCKKDFTVDGQE